VRHFLGRIHHLKDAVVSCGARRVRLSAKIIYGIHLFIIFLDQDHDDMSMHLLTYRTPDHHHHDDACEKKIDGYDMATGKAWRWEIPQDYWVKFTLNSLEFIASFISFWIGILDGTIKDGDCVLSETDSTSAQGWLYKSNFDASDQEMQMLIARKMAEIANADGVVLYSQWLPGKENIVYDCISRNHNMSDPDLVHMHFYPQTYFRGLHHQSLAQQNRLLRLLVGAENASDDAITEGTTKEAKRSWEQWLKFCQQVGVTDTLLV
jgi:hypothetical protein